MRRATFLTSLFGLLLLITLLQVLSMTSSPLSGLGDNVPPRAAGKYSAVVAPKPLGAAVVHGHHAQPSRPAEVAGVSMRELSTSPRAAPDATVASVVGNLSAATVVLVDRVAERRNRIEQRRRAQEAQLSAQTKWSRFIKGAAKRVTGVSMVEEGNVEPPEDVADALHIRTEYHKYTTAEELLERYRYLDIVYTWVNGSEHNHLFRKYYRRNPIKKHFVPLYGENRTSTEADDGPPMVRAADHGGAPTGRRGKLALKPPADAPGEGQGVNASALKARGLRWVPYEPNRDMSSLNDVTSFLDANRLRFVTSRDRESDELRYSIRSLDQFVDWHHGRILIVAPGHCPLWLDHTANFFARSQRPLGHVRRRLVAVHQDAIVPGNQRLTFNTNGIEQHVHKLKNLSNLFVQFNDDYFVNHPTTVGDFVNANGGPTLLHEGGEVRGAALAHRTIKKIWLGGVYNSNAFNIRELEEVPVQYVPKYVAAAVRRRMQSTTAAVEPTATAGAVRSEDATATTATGTAATPQPAEDTIVTETGTTSTTQRRLLEAQVSQQRRRVAGRPIARVLDEKTGEELKEQHPKRRRYFLKHAPFVYCRRMFEHLAERYQRDFTAPAVANPHRNRGDLLMPFIHNAFAMDRPWAGSPNYLPHLMALAANRTTATLTVRLDNEDGCAPALSKVGEAAKSLLVIFIDDTKENERRIERLADVNPIFFALNDGFTRAEAAMQLREFMAAKYPDPSVFEAPPLLLAPPRAAAPDQRGDAERDEVDREGDRMEAAEAAASTARTPSQQQADAFRAVMALPLVVVVNTDDVDAVCPLLRSLRLAMPEHTGRVVVVPGAFAGSVPVPVDTARAVLDDRAARLLTTCVWDQSQVEVMPPVPQVPRRHLGDPRHLLAVVASISTAMMANNDSTTARLERRTIDLLPPQYGEVQDRIGGIALDMRRSHKHGPFALAALGQTLALEDFALLPPTKDGQRQWLYLSPCPVRQQTARRIEQTLQAAGNGGDAHPLLWAVNWIHGASAEHLLHTFPIPHRRYEDVARLRYVYDGESSW